MNAYLVIAESDVNLLNVGSTDTVQTWNVSDHLETPEDVDMPEALGIGQNSEQKRHDIVLGTNRVRVQFETLQGIDDLKHGMERRVEFSKTF